MDLQKIVDGLTIDKMIEVVNSHPDHTVYFAEHGCRCLIAQVVSSLYNERIVYVYKLHIEEYIIDDYHFSPPFDPDPSARKEGYATTPEFIADLIDDFDTRFRDSLCTKTDALDFLGGTSQKGT